MTVVPVSKPLESWQDLSDLYKEKKGHWDGWLFRGQSYRKEKEGRETKNGKSDPSLKTSLELAMERFGVSPNEAPTLEYRLLRDFARRCHFDTGHVPPTTNTMEWLALLRHYGGPARLQDWTYSFWVAVHFALDRAKNEENICEVWALNARWWVEQVKKKYSELARVLQKHSSNSPEEGKAIFKMKGKSGIWVMNPFADT